MKIVDLFYKRLGYIMWEYCGMFRNVSGFKEVLIRIFQLCEEFWNDVWILGDFFFINFEFEKVGWVVDFLELSELMCWDVLECNEFCGGYFCEEYEIFENEVKRDDVNFSYVVVWEWCGLGYWEMCY